MPSFISRRGKKVSRSHLVDTIILSFVKKHGLDRVLHAMKKRKRILCKSEEQKQKSQSKLITLLISSEYIFQFLNLSELSLLDSSFTNHDIRPTWLNCRKFICDSNGGKTFNLYHDDEISWCVSRNVFPQSLSIESDNINNSQLLSLSSVSDEGLSRLAEHCSHLKSFKLSFTESISNVGFSSFTACCPNLQTLILNNCSTITDDSLEMIAIYCDKIIDINIAYCENVSDSGFEAIFKGCGTRLKSFSYHCQYHDALKNFRLLSNIGMYCQVLEYLDLAYLVLTSDGIASFFSITDNNTNINNGNDDNDYNEYNKFKSHKFHKVYKYNDIINSSRSDIGNRSSARGDNTVRFSSTSSNNGCQMLKSIHIDNIIGAKLDYFVECISLNCHNLESIELGTVYPIGTEITNNSLQSIFQGCGLLKSLRIRQPLPNITDSAFHSLSHYCPLLEEIEFNCIPAKMTTKTMIEIGKLKSLRRFHFIHNDTISDICIYDMFNIASSNGDKDNNNDTTNKSSLESIAITIDGMKITETSIVIIANHCPYLHEIQILDNQQHLVSPTVIQYLIQQCPMLRGIHNGEVSMQICNKEVKEGGSDIDYGDEANMYKNEDLSVVKDTNNNNYNNWTEII